MTGRDLNPSSCNDRVVPLEFERFSRDITRTAVELFTWGQNSRPSLTVMVLRLILKALVLRYAVV